MVASEKSLTVKELKSRTEGNEMDLSLMGLSKVPVKEIVSKKLIKDVYLMWLFESVFTNTVYFYLVLQLLHLFQAAVTKANTVDLSCNRIVILPDIFCNMLKHLIKLDLSKNQLQELPDDFGKLEHLQHLDLYHNKLR